MNSSYDDDSTNSAHGRARIPGANGAARYDGYDSAGDGYSSTHAARAPSNGAAGRATVGRASVRPAGGFDEYDSGPGPVAAPRRSGASGRASVSGSGASGRAPVGRATVGAPDELTGFSGDPDRTRSGTTPGVPSGPDRAARVKRLKKARRRNLILSALALIIMLSGLSVVGGTYYFNKVPTPADYNPPQSTTIYYSDGKTQMAKFGDQNRTIVDLKTGVSPWAPEAVVATEDNSFYTNSGVSIRGIFRAAWNNLKGGNTQGGSTITQQYVRQVLDATTTDRTVTLKIKEAVAAMKLDQSKSKDAIMQDYLNVVYFGRGAYGIEAASQAFFKHSAKTLTAAESMVLAGVIKDPSGGFDPAKNPQAAHDRFNNYIKPNMVKLGYLTQAQADALVYPTVITPASAASAAAFGMDKPTGLVVHHVMDELSHMTRADGSQVFPDLKDGGYSIITTIDKNMEQDALNAAGRTQPGSLMVKQPKNLQDALVAVQPGTGRVLAYYGGDRGDGLDFAGIFRDPVLGDCGPKVNGICQGTWSGSGHRPGSSFKVYTLATALQNGISLDSYWNGAKTREFPKEGRVKGSAQGPVRNSGASCASCPLWFALQQSMNTVFYAVGEKVTANKILNMAHAMGINHMWATVSSDGGKTVKPQRIDFNTDNPGQLYGGKYFDTEVSIGQYPVTVADHANGVATIANYGVEAQEHFVLSVSRGGDVVYKEATPKQSLIKTMGLTQEEMDDEQWAMGQVLAPNANNGDGGVRLANGRPAGGKTGTWELATNSADNAHAWFVGFTPKQLAAAVWVGNKGNEQAIKTSGGNRIFGATLPGPMWKKFMDLALKNADKVDLEKKAGTGDTTAGDASSPQPTAPPTTVPPTGNPGGGDNPCQGQLPCVSPTPTDPGGGGNSPSPTRSRRGG
jgi:membrane peptidoglycan carboxypeptidase